VSHAVGVAAIVAGAALALGVVFFLWGRLAAVVAFAALTIAGVLVGVGALAVQAHVGFADRVVTVLVLAVLTPVHGRLVFGKPGERA
jgi:uncharacterized membrane protein